MLAWIIGSFEIALAVGVILYFALALGPPLIGPWLKRKPPPRDRRW